MLEYSKKSDDWTRFRSKVGQMTQTIQVTWVSSLMGHVGLIHKLNYLDLTRIFNRSHILLETSATTFA